MPGRKTMRARIVKIGNSRGLRIPKPLLRLAGLDDEVELEAVEQGLLVRPLSQPREGWDKAARELAARGEVGLLDLPTPTRFDELEWEWD